MFPSQDDTPIGMDDGAVGGPPPADALFESFLNDGLDDIGDPEAAFVPRETEVLNAGLHFFERMNEA